MHLAQKVVDWSQGYNKMLLKYTLTLNLNLKSPV